MVLLLFSFFISFLFDLLLFLFSFFVLFFFGRFSRAHVENLKQTLRKVSKFTKAVATKHEGVFRQRKCAGSCEVHLSEPCSSVYQRASKSQRKSLKENIHKEDPRKDPCVSLRVSSPPKTPRRKVSQFARRTVQHLLHCGAFRLLGCKAPVRPEGGFYAFLNFEDQFRSPEKNL